MDVEGVLDAFESEVAERARLNLHKKWNEWNEEELKVNFIGLVFFLANLDEPEVISTYFERKLSGEVNSIPISLVVDCMVATPKNSGLPKRPYFFMQEFKRSKGDSHDPEGQMLSAMILSQHLNNDGKPLYGCWLQGRIWQFTTLLSNHYCVSKAFDATNKHDLKELILILRKLKMLILNR
jgi:hypothetical protein